MTTKRQLAAIMFTDITGYSAMMQADEEYARQIRNRHRSVFKETHARHGGNILQYYGDGTLSIFDSAAAAVECAVNMQIEYRREPEVPLRIGIHTGDISWDHDGAYGDGLNIAARIEKLSVPGSVFISAKVYDDIKNHRWLTAVSLGPFRLRNIHREFEIYAVTCKGMEVPTVEEVESYPEYTGGEDIKEAEVQVAPTARGYKKKGVTAFLAFFLGMWGIHRFYLGQKGKAIIWLVGAVISLLITVNADPDFPPIVIFPLLGFIDFVLFLAMPKAEFDQKYNKVTDGTTRQGKKEQKRRRKQPIRAQRRRESLSESPTPRPIRTQRRNRPQPVVPKSVALSDGIRLYKSERYEEAIDAFIDALKEDPTLTAAYFNIACSYAILKNAESAYYYLAQAVEHGFSDYDRIETHEALASLRERPDFQGFVQNGYRVVEQLPEPQENLIENIQRFNPDILEQLENLGDLMEKGEMTRDEFEVEKRKILGSDE